MDRRRLLQLWGDSKLKLSICKEARRYFSTSADREVAEAEAWRAIEETAAGTRKSDIEDIAHNAIEALYRRRYRARGNPVST